MEKHKITRPDGKEVKVTVPPKLTEEEEFFEHITSVLSPEAVGAIIAFLQGSDVWLRPKNEDDSEFMIYC